MTERARRSIKSLANKKQTGGKKGDYVITPPHIQDVFGEFAVFKFFFFPCSLKPKHVRCKLGLS